MRLGGSGVCPGFTAKGPCNRLCTIFELPVTRESGLRSNRVFSYLWALPAATAFGLLFGLGPLLAARTAPVCGSTANEAIAAAETALATKADPDKQTVALSCLLQAVKRLAAAQPVVTRGADKHEVLHLPSVSGKTERR